MEPAEGDKTDIDVTKIRVVPPKSSHEDPLMAEWMTRTNERQVNQKLQVHLGAQEPPSLLEQYHEHTISTMLAMQRHPNPLCPAGHFQFPKLLPHTNPGYAKAHIKYARENEGRCMPPDIFLWVASFEPKEECATLEAIDAKLQELNPLEEYPLIVAMNKEKAPLESWAE